MSEILESNLIVPGASEISVFSGGSLFEFGLFLSWPRQARFAS